MKKLIIILLLIFSISIFSDNSINRNDILNEPGWKNIYEEYTFENDVIELIRGKSENFNKIDIYFGFWCGDSETNVPKFIKILDKLSLKDLKITYYSLGRKKTGEKFFVKPIKIERVPTFVFYKGKKEIGRIIENPKQDLLTDFLDIVF